jgi:hypothetical protein
MEIPMTRTRSALSFLLATTTLAGCATAELAQDVELDNLEQALEQAMIAGDYELAMQLGHEYVGLPISADPSLPPVDGFLSGIIEPAQGGGPVAILQGRLMDAESMERHQIGGVMATPLEGQVRGVIEADTRVLETAAMGRLMGDFRTIGERTDNGPVRATWNVEGVEGTAYIRGVWQMDEDGTGRMFGIYERIAAPDWDQGVRIRIEVAGLTLLTIAEDKLWVTTLLEDESFEGEIGGAIVNGEAYELVYSEVSCPDGAGNGCRSEAYTPADGAVIDMRGGVEMTALLGRGGMVVVGEPSAVNEYTTEILIDDLNYYGSSTYELEITPSL